MATKKKAAKKKEAKKAVKKRAAAKGAAAKKELWFEVWDPREGSRIDVGRSYRAPTPEFAARLHARAFCDLGEGSPWDGQLSVRNEQTKKTVKLKVSVIEPDPEDFELSVARVSRSSSRSAPS